MSTLSLLFASKFVKNIVLGISLAAPIGPVSIETIRQGFSFGFRRALHVVLGAVVGDFATMLLFYFMLSPFMKVPLVELSVWALGACLLIYLGASSIYQGLYSSQLIDTFTTHTKNGFFLGFVLAVVNPISIAFWIGIAGLIFEDANSQGNLMENLLANLSIFLGVLLWGIFLSLWVALGRQYLKQRGLRCVALLSGLCLLSFGLYYLQLGLFTLLTFFS